MTSTANARETDKASATNPHREVDRLERERVRTDRRIRRHLAEDRVVIERAKRLERYWR
jgi:hypothetical protein